MLVKVPGIALRGRGNLVVERGRGNLTIERGRGNLTIERGKGGQDTVLVRKEKSPKLNPTELGKHLCELGDQLFTGTCYSSPKNHRTKEPRPKVSHFRFLSLLLLTFTNKVFFRKVERVLT